MLCEASLWPDDAGSGGDLVLVGLTALDGLEGGGLAAGNTGNVEAAVLLAVATGEGAERTVEGNGFANDQPGVDRVEGLAGDGGDGGDSVSLGVLATDAQGGVRRLLLVVVGAAAEAGDFALDRVILFAGVSGGCSVVVDRKVGVVEHVVGVVHGSLFFLGIVRVLTRSFSLYSSFSGCFLCNRGLG